MSPYILLGAAAIAIFALSQKQSTPSGTPGKPPPPPPPGGGGGGGPIPLPPLPGQGGGPQPLPGPDPQCLGLDANLTGLQCAEIKYAVNPATVLTPQFMQTLLDRYPAAKYPIAAGLLEARKHVMDATGH